MVSAYKWVREQDDDVESTWIRIKDGVLYWYHEERSNGTGKAFPVLAYSLKDKDLATLELEEVTTRAGTFHALKITARAPSYNETGIWWLAPGVGMVLYKGEQDDGSKYGLELIDY